jgi:hypothetical protein
VNWEQKLMALKALAETHLEMRRPGDWYVSAPGRGVCGDGLEVGAYGNGATPQEAVEDDWKQVAEHLPLNKHIKISKSPYGPGDIRRVRWNGFMWQDLLV